jgi:glyoxylase-like metal-dependent hydrolase (beta-lactamase superfamily II)
MLYYISIGVIMEIYTFKSEYPYGSNTYVLSSNGEYAIIDPSASVDNVLTMLGTTAAAFRYVILTHAHFDHILFIDEWQKATKLSVTVSAQDAEMLRDPYLNCYQLFFGKNIAFYGEVTTVSDGNELVLGNTTLKIHSAPGHTAGSILIEEGNSLFVGDTVFAGQSYGRCDLPSGNFEKLKKSIEKIHLFDQDINIYPGHGEKTKVSEIIRF